MPRPHHPLTRLLPHTSLALAAFCLLLIAASYTFRHNCYTSTSSGHTIGLIRGRLWFAHLPDMPAAAIDAWWAAHGASDRADLPTLGPWPHRETIGPRGWAFALPLWIPLALLSLAAAAARFAPQRNRTPHSRPANQSEPS